MSIQTQVCVLGVRVRYTFFLSRVHTIKLDLSLVDIPNLEVPASFFVAAYHVIFKLSQVNALFK